MTDTLDHDQDRPLIDEKGRFKKGHTPKVRRATGTRNKIVRDIKEGFTQSAIEHGSDGKGTGGMKGFSDWLMKEDLRAWCHIFGKLVPRDVSADISIGVGVRSLKIVSVPHDRYLSPDQVRRLTHPDPGPPPVDVDAVVIDSENDPPPPEMVRVEEPDPPEVEVDLSNVTRLNPWDPK